MQLVSDCRYAGNGATVMKVVPQSAIQMSVYDTTKDFILSRQSGVELSNLQRLFAGTPRCPNGQCR